MGFPLISIFSALTSLIDPVSRIVGQIADAREKREQLENDHEKIIADERIHALEMKRDVLLGETSSRGWWVSPFVRIGFALPFMLYFWVAIFFGRTLEREWAVISDLSPEQWELAKWIIGFYFLFEAAKVVRKR